MIIFGIKDILVFNNTHANYLKKNQEGTSCNMKELFTDPPSEARSLIVQVTVGWRPQYLYILHDV